MVRFYLSQFLGDGLTPETAYKTAAQTLPAASWAKCVQVDMRLFEVIGDGFAIIWADWTDAEHAALIAHPEVTYLPFEAGGVPVALDSPLSAVDSANVTTIQNAMLANNIPTDGITMATTVRQAMQKIIRRAVLKKVMRYLDFPNLTATVGSLDATTRKAINRSLTNWGFDTSGITAAMTFRQALVQLMAQPAMDTIVQSLVGFNV